MELPYHYLRQLLFFRCAFYSGITESFTCVSTILLQQPFFKSIQFVHASTFVDSNGLAHDMHTNNNPFLGILVTQMIKATCHCLQLLHFVTLLFAHDTECLLQLLAEKGELPTRFGSATLGILLLQVLNLYILSVSNVAFIHESSKAPRGVRCIDSRMYSVDTHRTLQLSPCWLYSLC